MIFFFKKSAQSKGLLTKTLMKDFNHVFVERHEFQRPQKQPIALFGMLVLQNKHQKHFRSQCVWFGFWGAGVATKLNYRNWKGNLENYIICNRSNVWTFLPGKLNTPKNHYRYYAFNLTLLKITKLSILHKKHLQKCQIETWKLSNHNFTTRIKISKNGCSEKCTPNKLINLSRRTKRNMSL